MFANVRVSMAIVRSHLNSRFKTSRSNLSTEQNFLGSFDSPTF